MPLSLLKTPRKSPQKPEEAPETGSAGDVDVDRDVVRTAVAEYRVEHSMKNRLGTGIIHNEQLSYTIFDRDAEQCLSPRKAGLHH